jgi:hypothetical protein
MKQLNRPRNVFLLPMMLAFALSLLAIPGSAWSSLRDDIRDFHMFLQDHPRISSELRANPNLVNNRRYLDDRDELARFLRRRPGLRQEIVYNPDRVFSRYYSYNRYNRYDRYDRYNRWR